MIIPEWAIKRHFEKPPTFVVCKALENIYGKIPRNGRNVLESRILIPNRKTEILIDLSGKKFKTFQPGGYLTYGYLKNVTPFNPISEINFLLLVYLLVVDQSLGFKKLGYRMKTGVTCVFVIMTKNKIKVVVKIWKEGEQKYKFASFYDREATFLRLRKGTQQLHI